MLDPVGTPNRTDDGGPVAEPALPYRVQPRTWGLGRVLPTRVYPDGRLGGTASAEEAAVFAYIAHLEAKIATPANHATAERVAAFEAEVARLRTALDEARRVPVSTPAYRSSAMKRQDVARILAEHPEWSNRRIAAEAGVGDDLVAAVRRALAAATPAPEPDAEAAVSAG